jgi:serine/threonine-protein kinase RsbW
MSLDPIVDLRPEDLHLHLNLRVSADPGNISFVVDEIMSSAQDVECIKEHEFEVEIALREALANAIVHGSGGDPAKTVQVTVACDHTHGLLIIVRDEGKGFDPSELPSCVVGENIYSNHGRGVFLMNQLMDEVRFEKNGTEVHLRKRVKPGEKESGN